MSNFYIFLLNEKQFLTVRQVHRLHHPVDVVVDHDRMDGGLARQLLQKKITFLLHKMPSKLVTAEDILC